VIVNILKANLTCMCLQSCPRAGKAIRRNVIGHFSEILIPVCSTPSSPFDSPLPEPALVKLRLTGNERNKSFNFVAIVVKLVQEINCDICDFVCLAHLWQLQLSTTYTFHVTCIIILYCNYSFAA